MIDVTITIRQEKLEQAVRCLLEFPKTLQLGIFGEVRESMWSEKYVFKKLGDFEKNVEEFIFLLKSRSFTPAVYLSNVDEKTIRKTLNSDQFTEITEVHFQKEQNGFLRISFFVHSSDEGEFVKYADDIFLIFSELDPVFGFICLKNEYEYRNKYCTKLKIADRFITSEQFLGNDLGRYIPGLYWKTLISNTLFEEHSLSVRSVENVSIGVRNYGTSRLFTFYDSPYNWKNRQKEIDQYIRNESAFFHLNYIDRVLEDVDMTIENQSKISSLLKNWR